MADILKLLFSTGKQFSRKCGQAHILARIVPSISFILLITPFSAFPEEVKSAKSKISGYAVEPIGTGSLIEVFIGLLIVLLVFVAMAWFMRRVGGVGRQAGGNMRVVGALSVGTRERVVLVKVGDDQILLGVAPGRVQALHKLDTPIEDDDGSNIENMGFSQRLKAALKQGKKV